MENKKSTIEVKKEESPVKSVFSRPVNTLLKSQDSVIKIEQIQDDDEEDNDDVCFFKKQEEDDEGD